MVACNEKMACGRTGGVAGGHLFSHSRFGDVACNARSASDCPSLGTWTSQDPAQYINGANTYQFVESSPVERIDPSGDFFGIDDLVFAIGGAVVGVASQALADAASGQMSSWQTYVGAAFGGAAAGEMIDEGVESPEAIGAVSAGAANLATQSANYFSGVQKSINLGELATATASGAALGSLGRLVPGLKIDGVTEGQGSWSSIFKQMATKAEKKLAKSVTLATAMKMFFGKYADDNEPPKSLIDKAFDKLADLAKDCPGAGRAQPKSPPHPLNSFYFAPSPSDPNGPEQVYQQWSDGSWHYWGQTGG